MFKTPKELQLALIELFPSFAGEVDDEYDDLYNSLTFHRVWMDFSPVANGLVSQVDKKCLKRFCTIINKSVERGGDQENSVSTCFLEHASQVDAYHFIKPYLSKKAGLELR